MAYIPTLEIFHRSFTQQLESAPAPQGRESSDPKTPPDFSEPARVRSSLR